MKGSASLHRSPFKPRKGKTWKRLHPINPRNKDRFIPPDSIAAVKKRSGGRCERMIVTEHNGRRHYCRCPKPAMRTPHHILARSQGGDHSPKNLLDLCFDDHRWATDNPKQAIIEGIVIPYAGFTP